MKCPKCFSEDVSIVGDDHYICNNPTCRNDDGTRVQFTVNQDNIIQFPYNEIFVDRNKNEFFRKPYLVIPAVGNMEE
jgi:hypothetical protein